MAQLASIADKLCSLYELGARIRGGADWPDIVEGICAKYSIPYYNYLSDKRFANNKTYFVDSSHLNDNGARAYTEIVAADIKCKLKTRCLTSDRFYESSACQ